MFSRSGVGLETWTAEKPHFDVGVEEENPPLEKARRRLFSGMWSWSFMAPGEKKKLHLISASSLLCLKRKPEAADNCQR